MEQADVCSSREQCLLPEARMTPPVVELHPEPVHRSFRLTRPGTSTGIASQVRPAMVLAERQARELLTAAERGDVGRGGCFSAGPAGIQVWSGPWDGELGRHGSSEHYGSVDWCYDTPNRHYITIYRVLVTARGAAAGQTAEGLLTRVLSLAQIDASAQQILAEGKGALPDAPARDPFRSQRLRSTISIGA